MAQEIRMPQLSERGEAAVIIGWRHQEGAVLKSSDVIAEVESDKATFELEAGHAGTLLKVAAPAGSAVRPGEVIGYIGEAGEALPKKKGDPILPELDGTLTPLSKMRGAIARSMQESASTIPHFYTTAAIRMDAGQELRETLRRRPEFKGISVNHLIIKAAAATLAKDRRANRAMHRDQLFEPNHINIGVVAAVEDGLLIPVIRDADKLTLAEVVSAARTLIDRAKTGKPQAGDLNGATFSISNIGTYDVENFTAIIHPGQGAILSVSAIREQAVVQGGQIVIGHVMRATLAVDHRVIDGTMSGSFLEQFKELLENPALLLL